MTINSNADGNKLTSLGRGGSFGSPNFELSPETSIVHPILN